ncbi:hypothetical protein ACFTWF_35115 [Rhodococcus sp. NPDC056960]|uniref:hypothetical protein n=1 Tax=Rhodococcus sp. NPDC056960 TaxID=3345982 RepID=UPI0036340A61
MNSHTSADPDMLTSRRSSRARRILDVAARSYLRLASIWTQLCPFTYFAVLTAVLTYMLGVYRYGDLGSTREQITAGERPTLSAVLDAAQAWGTAAEAIGSTATSTGYMLWLLIAAAVINAASVPLLWAVTRESGITPRWGFPAVVFDAMTLVVRFIIACGFVAWSAGLPTILFSVQLWPQLAGSLLVGYLPVWMIRRDTVERILLRPRLVLTSPPQGSGADQ